jgi:hypothetical protein
MLALLLAAIAELERVSALLSRTDAPRPTLPYRLQWSSRYLLM